MRAVSETGTLLRHSRRDNVGVARIEESLRNLGKDLKRERRRCKKCLVFSGVDVTMQVSCGGRDRQIRMDILDKDLFDSTPGTPKNTSWSMGVMERLDAVLGPGPMDRAMFPLEPRAAVLPQTEFTEQILAGKFDSLFGTDHTVSQVAQDAAKGPPPPPTVEIESVLPIAPIGVELPKYPPVARLAHIDGLVDATFDVDETGVARNIRFVSEMRGSLLHPAVIEAISKWKFPKSAWGKSGETSIRFKLNCAPNHG